MAHDTNLLRAKRQKSFAALASVLAAVGLTLLKLVGGLLTGSLGLLAEAAHSALDLVAALLTLFAVRYAERPADREHPYGHGKIENLSAFIESGLLLLTCAWIVWEAIGRLRFGEAHVEATPWAFVIMLISIGVDLTRSRALERTAKEHGSQALEADALHFRTDIWSSAVVLLGLAAVWFGERIGDTGFWPKADAVAALGVSVIVVMVSVRLLKETIDALLDGAPTAHSEEILAAARGVTGVLDARRLRLRRAGNKLFADLVIGVPRTTNFGAAHAIAESVEAAVQAVAPRADIVIHIEPDVSPTESAADQIHFIARQQGARAHDVRVRQVDGALDADLHLEVAPEMTLVAAHTAASDLESAVRAANPSIRAVNVHLEAPLSEEGLHREVTDRDPNLRRRIRAITEDVAGPGSCHEIQMYEPGDSAGTVDLVLHVDFPGQAPIEDVHLQSARIERALRLALPNLGTVLVHAEPVAPRRVALLSDAGRTEDRR